MSNYSEFFTNEDDLNRPFKTNRNRARILAIAVFTQPWHILFHKLIGLYFQAKLKPEELKKVVSVVYSVSKIDYLYASFQLLSVPKK